MVADDQEKIDGAAPLANSVMAEVFDPDDFGAAVDGNGAPGSATEEIQCPHSRKMKRVYKIQGAMGIQVGPERHRGRSLRATNLYKARAPARKPLHGPVFRQSMLRDGRPKSG